MSWLVSRFASLAVATGQGSRLAVLAEVTSLLFCLASFDLHNVAPAVGEGFARQLEMICLGIRPSADKYLWLLLGCRAATQQSEGSDEGNCMFHNMFV